MPDRYIEKSFLLLMVASLLLHIGGFAALYYWPQNQPEVPKEPVFIDLQQMPDIKPQSQPQQQETRRQSEQRVRVKREMAPRGKDILITSPRPSMPLPPAMRPQPQNKHRDSTKAASDELPATKKPDLPMPLERRNSKVEPGSSVSSLLKPRNSSKPALDASLAIGAKKLSEIEDMLLKQYQTELEDSDVIRINADNIVYGSFYKRLKNEIVTHYVERAMSDNDALAIQKELGVNNLATALILITVNKNGDVLLDKSRIIKGSGIKVLDDYIMNSIKKLGPLGRLPKQHEGDELHVPYMLGYTVIGRIVR